jgi:predicted XRE-type DNA-binding protein
LSAFKCCADPDATAADIGGSASVVDQLIFRRICQMMPINLGSWTNTSNMQTLSEVGEAVAARRRSRGMKQGEAAPLAGISQETLSRFERGNVSEFGSRKLLAVLDVVGMELQFIETQTWALASWLI